jgi:hypothetical protein
VTPFITGTCREAIGGFAECGNEDWILFGHDGPGKCSVFRGQCSIKIGKQGDSQIVR